MSQSNSTPEEEQHPFDVEQFARETIQAIEFDDDIRHVHEERLLAIEEALSAPWPRRWLLLRRWRREVRASVATWPAEYIDPGDFRGRRQEWTDQQTLLMKLKRRRGRPSEETQTVGWERHTGWNPAGQPPSDQPLGPPWNMPGEDGTDGAQDAPNDPGEGFLP